MMKSDIKVLLKNLRLDDYEILMDNVGRSDSQVCRLVRGEEVLYLKIGSEDVFNLSRILHFLGDKPINTPKLLDSGEYGDKYYVLMSECLGIMTYDLEPNYAIKILAEKLKELHSIDFDTCEVIRDKSFFLDEVLSKRKNNSLTSDERKLYNLVSESSLDDDLVFAHGDYCLPNVLDDKGTVSLIDLDNGGVSFRIIDLIDCMNSIEYNFGDKKYSRMFLKEYGIEELDEEKATAIKALYKLLDS